METALEHVLTNSYKSMMISYIEAHHEDFEELIKLAVSDKQPYSWRAAWLLWSCMEENDLRVQLYIRQIVEAISTKNDDQQRELFIVLQKMELDDNFEGELFDICAGVWENTGKKPSIRYNAFKLIVKIARKYPDLSNEVKFLTQTHFIDNLSDTVKKSIFTMTAGLNHLKAGE